MGREESDCNDEIYERVNTTMLDCEKHLGESTRG